MQPQSDDNNKLETMGDRIRATRLARGLTVTDAARSVDVSRTQFHQWENGTAEHPRLRPLIAYAKLVDVSLDWLVNHQGPKPKGLRRPNP